MRFLPVSNLRAGMILGFGTLCLVLAISCAGRGKRHLNRAVYALYPCAVDDYVYERLRGAKRLFRVRACRADSGAYQYTGVFQCSNAQCLSLDEGARTRGAAELRCPEAEIELREVLPPFLFKASGCGHTVTYRCVMKDQVVQCNVEHFGIPVTPVGQ
jgi:hypothetical protein